LRGKQPKAQFAGLDDVGDARPAYVVRERWLRSQAMPIEQANQTLTHQIIFIISAGKCCLDKAAIVASIPIR
jgi:hypothetical protein